MFKSEKLKKLHREWKLSDEEFINKYWKIYKKAKYV